MVHTHDCVRTDRTVFFHGVDDSDNGADKHLTHLSQGVGCHFTQRSKQNSLVVGKKDNDVDDGVDDSAEDGDDD
eukprot:4876550-Ditylum_brightwellii.AAC.1